MAKKTILKKSKVAAQLKKNLQNVSLNRPIPQTPTKRHLATKTVKISFQVSCSVFAGVYTEYLIKFVAGVEVDIMVQNCYMYADSILCNLLLLFFKGDLGEVLDPGNVKDTLQFWVLLIVANNAAVGIVTSLFLKNLNRCLKD